MPSKPRIAIIGLGYVGLPLAIALARHFPLVGLDIDKSRVDELHRGHDRTGEVDSPALRATTMRFTSDPAAIKGSDVFIVTVPTPVDSSNEPDLSPLRSASRSVGAAMAKGAIVVYESTVYPGVTEDVCGPILAEHSGLRQGVDFFLGYSPERINPGDREHTVDRITKVVAGENPEVTKLLADIYGRVTTGGVFRAASIRVAEAAKVIENAQRDINIAFINEVTLIFQRLGLSVNDVLEASGTKWNFLNFRPGLVGGHCIGVDPYYLARCAIDSGHHPEIILAGRRVNDAMGSYIAETICKLLNHDGAAADILVLGLTFKENVPDLRNTKVVDIIEGLRRAGHRVVVHDPLADPEEARAHYGEALRASLDDAGQFDCVIGAVAHTPYTAFTQETFATLVRPGGLVADIKGIWRRTPMPEGIRFWQL